MAKVSTSSGQPAARQQAIVVLRPTQQLAIGGEGPVEPGRGLGI